MSAIELEMRMMKMKEIEICQQMNNIMNDGLLRINLAKGDKNALLKWQKNNVDNQNCFEKELKTL